MTDNTVIWVPDTALAVKIIVSAPQRNDPVFRIRGIDPCTRRVGALVEPGTRELTVWIGEGICLSSFECSHRIGSPMVWEGLRANLDGILDKAKPGISAIMSGLPKREIRYGYLQRVLKFLGQSFKLTNHNIWLRLDSSKEYNIH